MWVFQEGGAGDGRVQMRWQKRVPSVSRRLVCVAELTEKEMREE